MARSPDPPGGVASVNPPLLEVKDLSVTFRTERGLIRAVDGVSFGLEEGEVLGIVGESGSGKSVTMLAVMKMIRTSNARVTGEVIYKGDDLNGFSSAQMRGVRGGQVAMVFQDPMTSLTPVYRIGWQIVEQLQAHQDLSRGAARERALDLLRLVGIPSPELRIDNYPHQFSGGMLQRVTIAMALSCNPSLLIADEPTTALDVTIQAAILELLMRLRRELGLAVILITHDMGVVAEVADRVLVMYAGKVVEDATKAQIFSAPQHPYTWGLLGAMPRLDRPKMSRLQAIPGNPPSVVDPPRGCRFQPRCDHRFEKCTVSPELVDKLGDGHRDACHLAIVDKQQLAWHNAGLEDG